jgi:hypothetical protein
MCNDVAAILLDDNMGAERDIILHLQDGGLQQICETHLAYNPLHFPLLFPHGELDWHLAVQYHGDATSYNNKVSCCEFAAYKLYIKANAYSLLHCAARLFLQWCVEEYVKIKQQRLRFIRQNQVNLCADLYHGIRDMARQDHDLAHVGRFIVLPAMFNGGERYMRQQHQDAMAVVRVFGKPGLFITVTCSPQWPEVINNLLPNQRPGDCPDILARVFRLKLKAILEDLLKKNCLGIVMAYVYVIQFQKRGLPHAHILIILNHQHKPRRSDDYDRFVSAEIPDPDEHPMLHETVTKCMMHGPCGYLKANAVCMKDNKCKKNFPKSFNSETIQDGGGYPIYRHRDKGRTTIRRRVELDNRWVVPYNPYLAAKYNCHINVEIYSTVLSVKYLYKYVYKGHDRATVSVGTSSKIDKIEKCLSS